MIAKSPFKFILHGALGAAFVFAPCYIVAPVQAAENAKTIEKTIAVVPFETLGIGTQSGCAKRALFGINDEAEWQRVWGVHTQGIAEAQSLPRVDFSRQTVIAVLSGERQDEKSLQVAQVVRGPQETVVYFMTSDEKSWLDVGETAIGEPKAEAAKTSRPYVFVAIDKVTTPLRFADVFNAPDNCRKCAD